MSRYIESIRIVNGRVMNIKYHNLRFNGTRKWISSSSVFINIRKLIKVPASLSQEVVKCRVLYHEKVQEIQYQAYKVKKVQSAKTVTANHIDYFFKNENRKPLDKLFSKRETADDIIIIKHGLVTDAYYSNLAFLKDGIWYSPKSPLLQGTRRALLLTQGRIVLKDIYKDDIQSYEKVSFFNAMIPLGEVVIDTSQVEVV